MFVLIYTSVFLVFVASLFCFKRIVPSNCSQRVQHVFLNLRPQVANFLILLKLIASLLLTTVLDIVPRRMFNQFCVCMRPSTPSCSVQTLFVIVVSYVLAGHPLTAATVFVSLSILNILRVPMGLLPIMIAYTMQVRAHLCPSNTTDLPVWSKPSSRPELYTRNF